MQKRTRQLGGQLTEADKEGGGFSTMVVSLHSKNWASQRLDYWRSIGFQDLHGRIGLDGHLANAGVQDTFTIVITPYYSRAIGLELGIVYNSNAVRAVLRHGAWHDGAFMKKFETLDVKG